MNKMKWPVADPRGTLRTHPFQIISFSCSFRQFFFAIYTHPLRVDVPTLGNPGSATVDMYASIGFNYNLTQARFWCNGYSGWQRTYKRAKLRPYICSLGKIIFSEACVKNSVHSGGCLGRPHWADTPLGRHPLGRHLPGQTPPVHPGIRPKNGRYASY